MFFYIHLSLSTINDARCTNEMQSRTAKAKAAFDKMFVIVSKLDFKLKEETSEVLHLELFMVLKLGHFGK
jgi:hypothetical protein